MNCIMNDPLYDYLWDKDLLYREYDRTCLRFDRNCEYLEYFKTRPQNDRELYNFIIKELQYIIPMVKKGQMQQFPILLLIAILYWKLYSQPAAVKNICYTMYCDNECKKYSEVGFTEYIKSLPIILTRDVFKIVQLINNFNIYNIRGVKSTDTLPVRTTILHFLYPDVISIFDKMVLQSVGINEKNANHKIEYYKQYQQFAWELEDKYKDKILGAGFDEPPLRVIDMALWVNRGINN